MAIRLFVQASPRIRASVSVRGLRVVAPAFQKPSVTLSKATYQAIADYSVLQAAVSYQNLQSSIYFRNAVSTDLVLDPDTLNRYFRDEAFSVSDQTAIDFSRAVADEYLVADSTTFAVSKDVTDTLGVTDVADILLIIQRTFTDQLAVADNATVTFGKAATDAVSASDVLSRFVGKGLADNAPVTDALAYGISKPRSDSYTVTDLFSRSVSYNRDFTDGASLADVSSFSVGKRVTDSAVVADQFIRVVDYIRNPVEQVSASDSAPVFNVGYHIADGASVDDAFERTVSYVRSSAETITMLSDLRPDIDTGLGKADSVSTSDTHTFAVETLQTDAVLTVDQPAIAFSRPLADGATLSDIFDRAVVYSRAFDDAISIDDNATVGGVEKDTQAVKTNIVAMADEHDYSFGKVLADNFAVVEVLSRATSKALADTFDISETILIEKRSVASSMLNASAFNTVPLNN